MKLILKQDVDNLGEAGDVVSVKAGYGRNFLIPQGLAYVASEANMKRIEEERAQALERRRRDFLEARRRATQIEDLKLTFKARAGDDGKLFGSVTSADIAERMNALDIDFEVEKRMIDLEEPIKAIGESIVQVRFHPDVMVEVEIVVEREEG